MADIREQLQETLGDSYRVDRELGGGGMSRVFLAEETALGRMVVVKVLHTDLAGGVSIERFRREIRVAARLQHPHIVPLLAAGETGGLPYFTMPYVEGESLRAELARGGELPLRKALHVLREIASALVYAHAHGVVHRDIKPENILISGGSAMVTDFGVAKALEASTREGVEELTSAGVALGTPAYMAPEQIAADGSADHRVDVYAFGLVAYELLTGHSPFAGRPAQAVFAAHMTERPEPLERRRPRLPVSLTSLVMQCLEKRPSDRPQSASELVDALDAAVAGEATPARSASRAWRVPMPVFVSAGVAAVMVVAFAVYVLRQRAGTDAPAAPIAEQSVAVMPFLNLSGVASDEYFSDGMTEELIGALSKVDGLRVAARSSVFALKGKHLPPRQVAERLDVTTVLEGTIRRANNRLRISAQLIDATSGYNLWAERYDRDPRDVFAIQDEISRAIVGSLLVRLAGRGTENPANSSVLVSQHRAPRDLETYDLYLKGRYFLSKRTPRGLETAISHFEQAIARDSAYALAYAALANAHGLLAAFGSVKPRQAYALAKVAALRAIQLDSTIAEAYASLGIVTLIYNLDPAAAQHQFSRAIALDPRNATAHLYNAWYYLHTGRPAEAVREATVARDLEPLSLIINTRLGTMLISAGLYDQAERQLRNTLELDSTFGVAHDQLALLLSARGEYAAAVVSARRAVELSYAHGNGTLGYALALSGDREAAERIVRALVEKSKREYVAPSEIGLVYAGLGNDAAAIEWLQQCYEMRDPLAILVPTHPLFKRLRTNPRFTALKPPSL